MSSSKTKRVGELPEYCNVLFEDGLLIDPTLVERLRRACAFQEHSEEQLVRILIEWALPYYESVRSVETLRGLPPPPKTSKR
jgi:hypothetical protein